MVDVFECYLEECHNRAEFLCRCNNVYICSLHIAGHVKQGHLPEAIYDPINCDTKSFLINFLDKEKSEYEKLHSKALRYFAYQMSRAEETVGERIFTISDQI